jgi:phosphotransferase system  glucose/maltose/N-acetylglucosamine-specific IIC component
MNTIEILHGFGFGFGALPVVVIYLILNVAVAIAVWKDAKQLEANGLLFLDKPWIWVFATIVIGLILAFFYWVIHYSRLARVQD